MAAKGTGRLRKAREIIDIGLALRESGLIADTHGNVSARDADGESMVITPSRRDYRSLEEGDLVRVDLATGHATGRWNPSSEWRLHAAIYEARRDVNAIVHHHAVWASAVSVARKTIPVLIDEAADIGPISTASYAASASKELAQSAAAELVRGSNAILLANHGAVAVGRDLREAFRRAVEVERLAKIYVGATVLGGRTRSTTRRWLRAWRSSGSTGPIPANDETRRAASVGSDGGGTPRTDDARRAVSSRTLFAGNSWVSNAVTPPTI